MKLKPPKIWLALAAVLMLAACGVQPEVPPGEAASLRAPPLRVAVAIAPHAWLVEQVAAGRAAVIELVEPGASPETYQPTDARVSALLRSSVYFRSGLPFERAPWFRAVETSGRVKMVDLEAAGGGGAPAERRHAGHTHPAHPAHGDPHSWLSPRLLSRQAEVVAEALAEADPAGEAAYREGCRGLRSRLEALDAELRRDLAPLAGRSFFVFHPAWGHFARDYGLHEVAIEIDGKEPADAELTALQRRAGSEGVLAVFVQPQTHGRAAAAVAAAVGARLEVLDPLEREVEANLRTVARRLRESLAEPAASAGVAAGTAAGAALRSP